MMLPQGRLEPTRAFGDGKYKSNKFFNLFPRLVQRYRETGWTAPYVTAEPETSERTLNKSHKFLVLACDGLFEDLTSAQVVDGVQEFLNASPDAKQGHNAATWLTKKALAAAAVSSGLGGETPGLLDYFVRLPQGRNRRRLHDDITIQVVFFDHEGTFPPQDPSLEAIKEPEILWRYRRAMAASAKRGGGSEAVSITIPQSKL